MNIDPEMSWLVRPNHARRKCVTAICAGLVSFGTVSSSLAQLAAHYEPSPAPLGAEISVPVHLQDGEEQRLSLERLKSHGALLFAANWTSQEGGGRPLTKGTGGPLADPSSPLIFPRNFNRVSAPDANSCGGCHNAPGLGAGGDIVANVFVLGHRFDFATFASTDEIPTRGGADERGLPVTLDDIANSRATIGMNGSGYIERLAVEMTRDLQEIRDSLAPGESLPLESKGISFGELARFDTGSWDTSAVEGLSAPSLSSMGLAPPSLIIRPFHQAGAVVSLRQFSNNAFNHHHGIQSTERFGDGADPDGDGFVDEMTRADVTAVSVWQATLPVPGRVISRDAAIERAVWLGEHLFERIGCSSCHTSSLPLEDARFVEPNPFNPPGNLQPGDAEPLFVDLQSSAPEGMRLPERHGRVLVPAYTDLKLHDITAGPEDPNAEPINMHFPPGSAEFFAGNTRFLTKKLWGAANEPPYFHHGKFTTLREAIEAHAGEAQEVTRAFQSLDEAGQAAVIEFLKSLRVLAAGSTERVVDEKGRPRRWPPRRR